MLGLQCVEALIHVSKTIIAYLDLDTALELIMSVTTDVMKVEASSLFLIDDETGELLFHIARGEKADIVKPVDAVTLQNTVIKLIGE